MPKMKTKSSAQRRFKVAGSGRVKCMHAGKRHNTGKKRQKIKRKLRKTVGVDKRDMVLIKDMMPYLNKF